MLYGCPAFIPPIKAANLARKSVKLIPNFFPGVADPDHQMTNMDYGLFFTLQ